MLNSSILPTLRLLGEADRLVELGMLNEGSLQTGLPLNYPAHHLLRELLHLWGEEAIHDYLWLPARRAKLLGLVRRRLQSRDYEGMRRHGVDVEEATTVRGAAVRAACRLLPFAFRGCRVGSLVLWANERDFAILECHENDTMHGRSFIMTSEVAASSLGRGYYAFSVHDCSDHFVQTSSVAVVAHVYGWLAASAMPLDGLTAFESVGVERLKSGGSCRLGLASDFLCMIKTHEVAHGLRIESHSPFEAMLRATNHDPSEAFLVGFPDRSLLQAWNRISAGECSTLDLTYVLGDVIANLTALSCVAVPQPTRDILTTYLWLVSSSKRQESPPRWMSISLQAAAGLEVDSLFEELRRVLLSAHRRPTVVADQLLWLDNQCRQRLLRVLEVRNQNGKFNRTS